MSGNAYAVRRPDVFDADPGRGDTIRQSLTGELGCSDTAVDAYGLGTGSRVELDADREHLCVPVAAGAPLALDGAVDLEPSGVGLLPGGIAGTVSSRSPASLFVVSVAVEPGPDAEPVTVDLDDVAFVVPETSDVATAYLTSTLGCRGMKTNARRLEPGQVVPYHTEGTQEELFLPVAGPGTMRIADESFETPPGTVARVAPDVPRSAANDGERDALWVMVGAPPTGGPTAWDPGAEILE